MCQGAGYNYVIHMKIWVGGGGSTSLLLSLMFIVRVGVERRLRERAWWRVTGLPLRAECRSSPFVSFGAKVLLALWGLLGYDWEVLLVIAVLVRGYGHAGIPGARTESYGTERRPVCPLAPVPKEVSL